MSIILKNGSTNPKILSTNLLKSLSTYSSLDIALLEESVIDAVKGYTQALSRKADKEQQWFGALDIFCNENYEEFLDKYTYVKKFIEDWKKLKNGNEHSARCQFGRLFYQILAKDNTMDFTYRKFPGKNFEYCLVRNKVLIHRSESK